MKALLGLLLMCSVSVFANNSRSTAKDTQLDDLVRGEMSAVKAYRQVLEKVKDKDEAKKLSAILKDHENAVVVLKKHGTNEVREDSVTSGAWGTFVETYTGGAKIFGDRAALSALRQGEEHGLNDYKEVLNDKDVSMEVKQIIKSELLPKQEKHIAIMSENL